MLEQLEQVHKEKDINIKMANNPIFVYDITMSSESVSLAQITEWIEDNAKKWVFQEEEGESGYKHYQIRLSLKAKQRPSTLINEIREWLVEIGADTIEKRISFHVSPTNNRATGQDWYVQKEATRIAGPWRSDDPKQTKLPRQYQSVMDAEGFSWKPWQKDIIDSADIFDYRCIDLIYDPIGRIGKGLVKAYVCCTGLGKAIPAINNYKDIIQMVMCHESKHHNKIYFLDLPRALDFKDMRNFFGAIETIKDGYAFDTRYSFKECYFDSPRVWVMTNSLPDMNLLSKDRWRLWLVKDDKLVPYVHKSEAEKVAEAQEKELKNIKTVETISNAIAKNGLLDSSEGRNFEIGKSYGWLDIQTS